MMNAKKIVAIVLTSLLIAFGAIFTVLYLDGFLEIQRHYSHDATVIIFELAPIIAMLMATALGIVSLVLILKNKVGGVAKIFYVLTAIFALPVAFAVGVWALHFIGIDFVPPPQQ